MSTVGKLIKIKISKDISFASWYQVVTDRIENNIISGGHQINKEPNTSINTKN